ncbi:MAG: SLBB domain-containing protein [Ignavibacteriales bacterium]|nr:SLBB domain-containing protein [Ignavibacteriales bacterium]
MAQFKSVVLVIVLVLLVGTKISAQEISGFYKVDNTGELTKKVNIWGYVKNPGRYEVPASTNLVQLISIAGGPQQYATLDNVKVFRLLDNGAKSEREVDVENLSKTLNSDLILNNEDTIVVDYSATVTWKDILNFLYTPVALVVSVIFIIDRVKK